MAVGRISGPLLKSNLIRNGINLAFETDLLYLDVNTQRIGIKTTSPQYELDVNGTVRTTNLEVENTANIADIVVSGSTISTTQPYLNLGTFDNVVYQNKLRVDSIDIEGNVVSTNSSNANLELRPNGTGSVNIHSDLNIDGNVYVTGNIRADGNIIIGDESTDGITINAEVASNIIPDADDTYTLGSETKKWADIWVANFNAGSISSDDLTVDGINLILRQGNIVYVAENGSDDNTGTHPQDPVASIQEAITKVTAGDTIHIFPGVYTETFPITVPAGVTIKGHSLRSVTVQPTVETEDNDAFLLNGETTVEDITIANFYYNNINNTGYAFRFANNASITTRSPYIRNITVISKGSTANPLDTSDPRGFNAGDAGKGAYIDGSVVAVGSKEASMLFHSATFITPGVDAIVCTNGVRIEWLNSFTYFANRSFYCFDSAEGKYSDGKTKIRLSGITGTFGSGETVTFTSTDASTVYVKTIESVQNNDVLIIDGKDTDLLNFDTTPQSIVSSGGATATTIENVDVRDFGAEVRMIGSASVYGNFGLVGDGEGVIVYAIGHNLAYIGNGKEVTNDPTTVIQDNEVVELNGAKVRFNSVDHEGDFRVGDLFLVDQQTGNVSFNSANFTINTSGGLTITDGSNTTLITATNIDTGNLRLSGNTLSSVSGPVNVQAENDNINLNADVNIDGNLDVTGNITLGGNITIGDESSDTIQFVAGIDSNILPSQDSAYSLGTNALRWSNVYVNQVNVDDIEIRDNYIETTASNADLELRANGSGNVLIPSNDVQINNSLTVNSTTTLADTTINGTLTHIGNYSQTGNTTVTGNVTISQSLIVGADAQFEEILIADNYITTTTSNADLELRANGSGDILIPDNDVRIINDLNVTGTITVGDINAAGTITADSFTTGDIVIDDNVITTTLSNSNLELRANGTGEILVPNNNVRIINDLTVSGTTSLSNTTIIGNVVHTGNYSQTGNTTVTGNVTISQSLIVGADAQFEEILIADNYITTTTSNADLELRANGSGDILIPDNDVTITNNLNVNGTLSVGNVVSTGTIQANNFTTGDILIDDNFITTTTSNSNLELRANGTGSIVIDTFSINNYTISSSGDFIIQPGNDILTIDATSAIKLPVGTTAERPTEESGQIRYNSQLSRFEGYNGSNWIQLNGVQDVDGDTKITAELTEGSNDNTIRFYVAGNVVADLTSDRLNANRITVDDIEIDGNVISTLTTNQDLELTANGTGSVVFDNFAFKDNTITNTVSNSITEFVNTSNGYVKFSGTAGLVIPVGSSAERPPTAFSETGMMRYNEDAERVEVYDGSVWTSVAGASSGITRLEAEDIAIQTVLYLG